MAARLLALVSLWDNPVFVRYCRSRLRFRKAVFWCLLVVIIATFQSVLTYVLETNRGRAPEQAARDLWIGLLVIQGLVLMIKGTGVVASGLIQDKLDATIDYQRLTPLTPLNNLVGYLFGLPVLEYVMFALTLPHLVFLVVVGDIPLGTVASVYVAFFTCVVLYHMTGIAAGMVMNRWIMGYLVSVFLVIFVNMILPGFASQIGLRFLQYLSVWPVISQKVAPLVVGAAAGADNPFLSATAPVPFYNWSLTPFVFTLLLQGALVVTFAKMATRRWVSATRHALSKPYALAFLAVFIVVLTGNIWPAITGRYLPFPIFGATSLDALGDAIALPLVYCVVIWALANLLLSIVTPSHDAYVRGIRRALKWGRTGARPWDDDAAGHAFTGLVLLVALAGLGVIMRELAAAGFFDALSDAGFSAWRLPLAFGLVVIYTSLLLQVLELRPTHLAVLLIWFVPILVAIVIAASTETFGQLHAVIASVSPLALLAMAGLLPTGYVADAPDMTLVPLRTGVHTGFAFIALQIAWLAWRWRRLSARYYAACAAGNTNT